ncbi:MAG: isopentenyl phosphate kinase [Methanoregulaceae archaeon]
MAEQERLMLKLGGSVITDKSGACAVDAPRLAEIAETIASWSNGPGKDRGLTIVHGAGSCGHPEAHRYHIRDGVRAGNREGVYVTHASVRSLNDAVVAALRARGVEAVGIHPLGACIADGGRIAAFIDGALEEMIRIGIVPVLHGDVAMDRSRGACIVSGDQLVRYLASALTIQRIGLATDVPGVLSDGKVVPEISRETVSRIQIGNSVHTDVTGGMSGKIRELLELTDAGIESEIFHVSRVRDFLEGNPTGGTKVRSNTHG